MVKLTRKEILKMEEFNSDGEVDEEKNFESEEIGTF
jgi:hypothetical protein